jgi:hypothetical protein
MMECLQCQAGASQFSKRMHALIDDHMWTRHHDLLACTPGVEIKVESAFNNVRRSELKKT